MIVVTRPPFMRKAVCLHLFEHVTASARRGEKLLPQTPQALTVTSAELFKEQSYLLRGIKGRFICLLFLTGGPFHLEW
jgi:hypothetical protein